MCAKKLPFTDLLTLKKDIDGKLVFKLGSTDYALKPSKKTLDSIENDMSAEIKDDPYGHDATMWCEDILKEIRKIRKQTK